MVTDNSADSRKVDKKTALALWDSAVIPPNARKKKVDEPDEDGDANEFNGQDVMAFTVITKRGNKQHVRLCYILSSFLSMTGASDTPNGSTRCISSGCAYSVSSIAR